MPSFFHARYLLAILAILVPMGSAPARAATDNSGLSSADQDIISKAENYLNAVSTLRAHFLQANPNGDVVEGTVSLARPGRLRLDYDPPSPILVVTHGTWLVYYDKQLKQTSYVDIDSTPAGILVKAQVQLNAGDLKVTKVSQPTGLINITVVRRNEPGQGNITLVFTNHPFELRQWRVLDAQGQVTQVSLQSPEAGVTFEDSLFYFKDPNQTEGIDVNKPD